MAAGGVTGVLLYAVIAAVLGMLQFGFNTTVINAPQVFIIQFIKNANNTSHELAESLFVIAVSIFAIGGALGCPLGGWLSERYGRKGALFINSVLGIIGGLLMGLSRVANSYEMLLIGRFVVGINCGYATTVSPTYVSEVAPLRLRGGFGTVNQLAVGFGLITGQILGIDDALGTADLWGWLLGLAVIPSLLQMLLLPWCPESPRYLLLSKKDEEASRNALIKLRSQTDIQSEIDEMQAEERSQQEEPEFTILDLLRTQSLRKPLLIGIVMHMSQQLSGINAVFYYAVSIFTQAGLQEEEARLANIGIGVVMIIMILVSVPLMDRAGRRTLHLTGLAGMFVSSLLMTVGLLTASNNSTMRIFAIIFTLVYVAFFGVGPGSIPWMLMSELFSQGPRSAAVGVGSLINWIANFIIGIVFLPLNNLLGDYVFLPFSVLLLLFYIFLYFKLPETKNRPVEEIVALFRKD